MVVPQGMPLKGSPKESIVKLASGGCVTWLGFKISQAHPRTCLHDGQPRLEEFAGALGIAHTKSDAPLRAVQTIKFWLSQKGPAYKVLRPGKIANWITERAHALGFQEIPSSKKLIEFWQRAYARWDKLRCSMTAATEKSPVSPTDR